MIFTNEWFTTHQAKEQAQIITLLLIVSLEPKDLFFHSATLREVLTSLHLSKETLNENFINSLLPHLQKPLIPLIIDNLLLLKQESLCDTQAQKALIHKLDLLLIQQTKPHKKPLPKAFFSRSLQILQETLTTLQPLIHNPKILQDLQHTVENLTHQKFSIGVTGVLSAGKSTLLNALLAKEILGSSTIPETANLTSLQYATTESAEVLFWNKTEWEALVKTSHFTEETSFFHPSNLQKYTEEINTYIKESSVSKTIDLDALQAYTSANHADKLCYFVKKVSLFLPLSVLKATQIVDTPGLDDPIIEREIITREYLSHCDLMIHAINASQPATQKDISFILESLMSQNIARILVILTRADLLEPSELQASLQYTQTTLLEQLRANLGDKDKYLPLANRLSFLTLSSYQALLHRTHQADKATQSLEQSGFCRLEEYLNTVLLGEDSLKNRDIIYLSTQRFLSNLKIIQEELDLNLSFLESSTENFTKLLHAQKALLDRNLHALKEARNQQDALKNDLEEFLSTLENLLNHKLLDMQNILIERLSGEIIYCHTHSSGVKNERLHDIVSRGLQDFLIDITREYGQKLTDKVNTLSQALLQLPQEFTDLNLSYEWRNPPILQYFCTQDSISQTTQGIMHTLPKVANAYSPKADIHHKLKELFTSTLEGFSQILKQKASFFKTQLRDFFYKEMEDFLETTAKLIEAKQYNLAQAKAEQGHTAEDKQHRRIQIRTQQNTLKQIEQELDQLLEQCL